MAGAHAGGDAHPGTERRCVRGSKTRFRFSISAVVTSGSIDGCSFLLRISCSRRCCGCSNAYAEHFVRTVRAECLDWLLILGRRHLEYVLRTYAAPWGSKTQADAESPLSCGKFVLVDEAAEYVVSLDSAWLSGVGWRGGLFLLGRQESE
jgi:hypothetical protein